MSIGSPEYFLREFAKYPEGHERETAMATYFSRVLKASQKALEDEKALRLAAYRDIVQRLENASPFTALALSLDQAARDMEED